MAAPERRTKQLCVFAVTVAVALSWLCVATTEALDVDGDGVIDWKPLPPMEEFKSDADGYTEDNKRPGLLADMSRGWVSLIQPQGLPIDYMNHLLKLSSSGFEDVDILDEVLRGAEAFVGIVVCFLIGLLFCLLLPVIGLFFCCCRCCDNCGGERVQDEPKSMGCKRVTFTMLLLCVTGIICCGMAYTNETNNFMGHAATQSFDILENDVLADTTTFFEGADLQLQDILQTQYDGVDDLIRADLNEIGSLIGTPFQEYLMTDANVEDTYQAFDELIADINTTTMTLRKASDLKLNLTTDRDALQTNLTDIKQSLDALNATCTGCVPANNGLTVTDFTQLPDLTDDADRSVDVEGNITEEYNKVKAEFNSIPGVIEQEAASLVSDVKDILDSTKEDLDNSYVEVSDQLKMFTDQVKEIQEIIGNASEQQQEYEAWRRYTVIGLCCMVLLIVMFNIIGITMGTFSYKNVSPVDRSRMSNAGGNVLVAGVVFTFFFAPLLMYLCSFTFMPLAMGSLTCKPLADLSILNETIDVKDSLPECEGYCAGKFILQNGSIPLTFTGILEGCRNNQSLYKSFMLDAIFDSNFIDDELDKIREIAARLVDEITVDDLNLDLVPDTFRQDLQLTIDAIGIKLENWTKAEKLLTDPLISDDLLTYADELDTAADGESGATETQLRAIAQELRVLQNDAVPPIQVDMTTTLNTVQYIQNLSRMLDAGVNKTADEAITAETLINTNETENALKGDVNDYIDLVVGYVEQYTEWAIGSIEEDFARCAPVREVYDTMVTTSCYYAMDALNIFWFTLGWCVFFFVPSIILSIKLAKYYRIMDYLQESKPKKTKPSKKKTSNQRDEEMPMDDITDDGRDNIRLVSNRHPPPMMAQQNPQYIPGDPRYQQSPIPQGPGGINQQQYPQQHQQYPQQPQQGYYQPQPSGGPAPGQRPPSYGGPGEGYPSGPYMPQQQQSFDMGPIPKQNPYSYNQYEHNKTYQEPF